MELKAIFGKPIPNIIQNGAHILITCITHYNGSLVVFERNAMIIEDNMPQTLDFPFDFLNYGEPPEAAVERIIKAKGIESNGIAPLQFISDAENNPDWELNLLFAVELGENPLGKTKGETIQLINQSALPSMIGKFKKKEIAQLLAEIRWF